MKNFLWFGMVFFSLTTLAQDSHYWSQQCGPRTALLGGAVIAGVRDNSAIFYNPGSLGFINNKNLSITATGYEFDQVLIPDGAGTGVEIKSRTLQAMPLIISGIFKSDKFPRHTLGYCLLTKDQFNIKTSARHEEVENVLNDSYSPGLEKYTGQFTFKSSAYEMLTGWAYSYKISDKFSLGLGNYGSYRSLHADTYIATRAYSADSFNFVPVRISSFNEMKSVEIKNIRTFFKLGMALDLHKSKLGITVTSPSMNVVGWATVDEDFTFNNMNVLGIGTLYSLSISDRQEGLNSTYRTPLSIAFGAEHAFKTTSVMMACEWFDKVPIYKMVTPHEKILVNTILPVNISSTQYLSVEEYKRSVINFAFAIEQKLAEKIKLEASFRSNQSFTVRDSLSDVRVNFTDWNIYHLVIGCTKKKEKSDVSLGIAYSFGSTKNRNQWVNFTEPVEQRLLTGSLKKTTVSYHSLSFIIGYTFYFK